MSEEVERRLEAAAAAMREHETTTRRCAELKALLDQAGDELAVLRNRQDDEEHDVEKLEKLSLTRVLTSLRGKRRDTLARERAEAEAARYKAAEAKGRFDALREEYRAAQDRLAKLAKAPAELATAIEAKDRHLAGAGDPRAAQLLALAEVRGRLDAEAREVDEAVRAANNAHLALTDLQDKLGSAANWSSFDTYLGGGAWASDVKHDRLDDAAQAAAHADRCLTVLRAELADVAEGYAHAPQLAVEGLTKFTDVWLDNVFSDLAVHRQIETATANVVRSLGLLAEVRRRLEHRQVQVRARLDTSETERQELLAA